MPIEVVLPKVDMDMESGVIAQWKVAAGDRVDEGDVLFEMETNKAMMEVEAPGAGTIRDLAAITGEALAVGTVVAWIDTDDDLAASPTGSDQPSAAAGGASGSAPAASAAAPVGSAAAPAPATAQAGTEAIRRVPLTPTRRMIGERLSESARTAPHFFLTAQVDMGALVAALAGKADEIERAAGAKPSVTALLAQIVGRLLLDHPLINASLSGDALELHDHVHVGVAMERDGDLVVPVLRDAHARSLAELTRELQRLREAVRARTIAPADMRGGTFTISNLGMYGVDAFTAIINPPESAILAIGRIADTPVGRDGQVVLRPMATLCLSSDHRVVDGVTAARFMSDLRAALERPEAPA